MSASCALGAIVLGSDLSQRSGWAATATRALLAAGWQVRHDVPHADDRVGLSSAALVLCAADVAAQMAGDFEWPFSAARVAVTDDYVHLAGFDDYVPVAADTATFAAIAHQWQPQSLPVATRRLFYVFGADAISPMLSSLADVLELALRSLDDFDATAAAHRVAGTAGTLGFAEMSCGWLAISEGDLSGIVALRRTTRLAIGAIRRRVAEHSDCKQVFDHAP